MSDSIQPTAKQIFLSMYKMAMNTNAEVKILRKIIIEMRFKLNEVLENTNKLDEKQTAIQDLERTMFLEKYEKISDDLVPDLEKYATGIAYEWAFEHDIDAIDFEGFGLLG